MMVEQVSDFKMPEKIVTRLIKEALPEDVILSKDAKNAACRFAGIFLLQLSMAAAEKAQMAKRRTLDNQDILKAMTELGLSECVPQLVRFGAQRKRNAKRKESNMIKGKAKRALDLDTGQQQSETPESNEPMGASGELHDEQQERILHNDHDEDMHDLELSLQVDETDELSPKNNDISDD